MNIDGQAILNSITVILQAIPQTLFMALIILVLGIFIGGIFAVIRIQKVPILSQLTTVYISYVRGVPLIVHLLVILNSLPNAWSTLMGIVGVQYEPNNFPNIAVALFTYTLLEAGIQSEIIRGAFQSVDKDQIEAGLSIGFSQRQNLRHLIIPQALSVALPLFLNGFLKIIKALSLAFTVGVIDILASARVAAALNYRYLEAYIAAALVYWVICGILQIFFDYGEKRYLRGTKSISKEAI